MGYCTKCGISLRESNRFCAKCGTPVKPELDYDENKQEISNEELSDSSLEQNIQGDSPPIFESTEPKPKFDAYESDHYSYAIDRRTLFDDGLLVLTSKDVILYSSDERDELKRIPLSSIADCSYSLLRRALVIKKRVHVDENFDTYIDEKREKYHKLQNKLASLDQLLKNTRTRSTRQDIKTQIAHVSYECQNLYDEIRQLETDPTKIQYIQKKVAEEDKEQFKLPKNLNKDEQKDEYKIWVYAIKRRLIGIPHIKIITEPYNCVVVVNARSVGSTPTTIELPLMDEAVLQGKYRIQILKEGYESEAFTISANPSKGNRLEYITLKESERPDSHLEEEISSLREIAPDRSLDLSYYAVEREVECQDEVLLLTRVVLLVMSKDKQQCYYQIPYGAINEAKYDKRFLRGNKSVKITYNERFYKNQTLEFWLHDKSGDISEAELKQRSESLADLLNRKRREETVIDDRQIRSKDFFIIKPSDLENNFERFEPFEFERLIGKLFESKGYTVEVTQERADFGVDVIAKAGHDVIAIQVKHWQAAVGGPDVHKTIGSMVTVGANRAMVITSSDFTNQAYEIQSRGAPIELWNGEKLRDEFRKYLKDAIKNAKNSEE